jgi:hypothetical protein
MRPQSKVFQKSFLSFFACWVLPGTVGGEKGQIYYQCSMDHEDAVNTYAAEGYLLGDLEETDAKAFEAHMFDCPVCAEHREDPTLKDPFLVEYALRQTFIVPRSMNNFSQRGWAMAQDIWNGNTPQKIRRFSESVLAPET